VAEVDASAERPQSSAGPIDRSVSLGVATLLGLALAAPPVALLLALHAKVHGRGSIDAAVNSLLGNLAVGLPLLALGIVVHELVHAIAWVAAGRGRWDRVRFGWQWRALAPFAHYTEPLPATAYRQGAVAPLLVLGVVPALAGTFAGWPAVAAFGWLLVVGAAGDLAVLWLLRGVPPDALVADHPTRAGCLVFPAPSSAPPVSDAP
jgi:Putative zincin peptidase